jgi:hypothetical protein
VTYDLWGKYQPNENTSMPEKKLWQAVLSKNKYVFSHSAKKTENNVTTLALTLPATCEKLKADLAKTSGFMAVQI